MNSKFLFMKFCVSFCSFCFLFLTASSQIQQDWDFYFSNIDDKPASIGLNLALHDTVPFTDKAQCFWIILKLQQPDSIGLPSEKENETLNKLEDELESLLNKKSASIYVGRTSSNGERYFYFYTPKLDSIDILIENYFENFPQYKYKLGHRYDDKWEVYFNFLYPSPLDLQLIYNHRIIDALAENGDNPRVLHHIDHWFNFEKKKDLNAFVKSLEGKNFLVEKTTTDKSQSFILQISEEAKTDLETIDNSVIQLFELAMKFNGAYGGWETFVMKE